MDEPSKRETPTLPRRGDRIGRYEIVAEVAQGGMAMVYATRLSSIGGFGKLLAMKVLAPNLVGDRQFVDMFLDEARIAAAVQHPNVVQVFDLGEHEGTPYLVMEYLRGQSLSRMIRRAGELRHPLPMGTLLAVAGRAAEGLHGAHETCDESGQPLGIVHRDVSPQNIHVGYDGQVKVVDFGIAAARGRLTKTRSGHLKGKFHYLAPEQISKQRTVDRRADLWALGVVLWELLTGRRLFRGDDDAETLWNVLNRPVRPLRELNPDVPRAVAELVTSLLQRDVRKRPPDAQTVARTLEAAAYEIGASDTSAIAATMGEMFARDRAVEDERLRAAVSEVPAPIKDEASSTEADAPLPPATRSGGLLSSRNVVVGGVLVAVVVGLAVFGPWGAAGVPTDDPTVAETPPEPPPEVETPPPGDVDTPVDEIDRTEVTVAIDPEVRLVLVDGLRRDERPLVLAIGPDEAVAVELVTPEGEMIRRAVTAEDDGITLLLDRGQDPVSPAQTRREPRRDSPTMMRRIEATPSAPESPSMMSPLIDNPYAP